HAPQPPIHSFPTRRSSDLHYRLTVGTVSRHGHVEHIFVQSEYLAYVRAEWRVFGKLEQSVYIGALYDSVVRAELFAAAKHTVARSEEHTSELQSRFDLVCR